MPLVGAPDLELLSPAGELTQRGWCWLRSGVSSSRLDELRLESQRLAEVPDDAVRTQAGAVYAARNVLDLSPQLAQAWRSPSLVEFVQEVCGPAAGLVRGLYFDKPPQQTWALPWHKDLLIAVADDSRFPGYSTPRLRAGVWHTQPPAEVLEQMLTLRIHLDAMTDENGPLEVLDESHLTGTELRIAGFTESRLNCDAGDVLAMRPLLVHSSGRSSPGCRDHRRVLHLEFSSFPELPGGARWHRFDPVCSPDAPPQTRHPECLTS